ncbi:MAG: transcriptional regulator [Citrobacter freundii]|nr:MAG: transcriptional regulator [Citrobacter freundii]
MKRWAFSLWFLFGLISHTYASDDRLLTELGNAIRMAAGYDSANIRRIDQLKTSLKEKAKSPQEIFWLQEKIYEAYKLFNYDSAYHYAGNLVNTSRNLPEQDYWVAARLKLSFILLSAGLYKETYDSLNSIARHPVPEALKGEYYALWGRYYYDLAGYANDHYHSVDYDIAGGKFIDSAIIYYSPGSFEYNYYRGLRLFKENRTTEAAGYLEKLMTDSSLTQHQLALTTSTLSGFYLQKGNMDKAIDLLIMATIADIRSSTKENGAIFHLAELLYKQGDIKHAVMCIESAVTNAEFYGARQRKVQASSILPLIEGERINGIEAQKSLLIKYAIIVTILGFTLLVLAWIIWRQVKKLKQAQEALTQAHQRQQEINHQLEESNQRLEELNLRLEESNHRLADLNEKLEDSNKIKEEYIGFFFRSDSEFYGKLEKVKTDIEKKLLERRYDDIRFFLNKIDTKKEKEELLHSFDIIFLKLFPNFLAEVNSLLREDEKIRLKEGELLSTDLRIFALMRMGVTDPEKIAQILEYSVKTIYSYKSRIKNKAVVSGDEFEERIMRVKTL